MGTMTVEQIFLLYDELTGLQHIAREAEQWGVRVQIVGTIGQCLSLASAAGVQAAFALSCQADKVFLHINRLRVVFPAAGRALFGSCRYNKAARAGGSLIESK